MPKSKQQYEFISDEEVETLRDRPGWYDVIVFNDSVTRGNFVRKILVAIFDFTPLDAVMATRTIEACGLVRVGTYRYAEARARVRTVRRLAAEREFPLRLALRSGRLAPENA